MAKTESGEYAGAAWFIWMPIVILAVLAPTMWWLATRRDTALRRVLKVTGRNLLKSAFGSVADI